MPKCHLSFSVDLASISVPRVDISLKDPISSMVHLTVSSCICLTRHSYWSLILDCQPVKPVFVVQSFRIALTKAGFIVVLIIP